MENVESSDSRIWTSDNQVCVHAAKAGMMYTYNFGGNVVRIERISAGYHEEAGLSAGAYIVILTDGTRNKVRIR